MLLLFGQQNADALAPIIQPPVWGGGPRLHVARYSEDGTELYEMLPAPANIGVRWALPGGVQRIEVTLRPRSEQDAFNRYRYNVGDQLVLFDDFLDKPIARGWIYEGRYDGKAITYIAGGAWKRHSDELVTTAPTSTDDTDDYLKVALDSVLSGGMEESNIMSTGVTIGYYEIDTVRGEYPDKIIADLVRMGDSSANIIDYWTQDRAFTSALTVPAPAAHLQARDSSAAATWKLRRADLKQNSLSRNAWSLRNQIDAYYGPTTTLSADANGGATSISVTSAASIAAEYEIEITLDSGRTHKSVVDSVSGTTVNLVDKIPNTGTNPTASSGNLVRTISPLTKISRNDTPSQANYWLRQHKEVAATYDATAAQNFADGMLTALAYPAAENAFTIGGPWIYDGDGRRWPIWRILTAPGVLEISDLAPDGDLLSQSIDALRSFRVIAVDYDHSARAARVVPDSWNGDQRIDVLLQQLGANVGQMINRV